MKKSFKESVLESIKAFDNIVILRHEHPDYDALGSQFGLYYWLKDNFPSKNIQVIGKDHPVFVPTLFPKCESFENVKENFLLFIVDTANLDRVDGKEIIEKASKIIKLDHHPLVEDYGDLVCVEPKYSAASELIIDLLSSYKGYKFNTEAAGYLYCGMVGDNGRFMYSSTSAKTFKMASKCLKAKINISQIYEKMYVKSIDDIKVLQYLYNNYKISEHGVAYFFIKDSVLKQFNMQIDGAKAFVNLFSGYKEIPIWVYFAEDIEANNWRVSIRSRGYNVSKVASEFNGGGHPNASGAKASDEAEALKIIEALDELIKE